MAEDGHASDAGICGAPCVYGGLAATQKHSKAHLGWMGHCNRRTSGGRCWQHRSVPLDARAGFWAAPVTLPETLRPELFWKHVEKTDSCWIWTARKTANGYGRYQTGSRTYAAHRLSWLMAHGSIDPTLSMDHLCRVRACVNPDHLEQVTMRENTLRGTNPASVNVTKTHCPAGHPYAGDNLGYERGTDRYCRTCKREQKAERRERKWLDPTLPEPCGDCELRFPNRMSLAQHHSQRHGNRAA